jgi:threonyl-tRNA synthetase
MLEPKIKDTKLMRLRHSLSHIMAQAVLEMFPQARLGTGPAIEEGFYYDFELPRAITQDDLKKLEKHMRQIIKSGAKFVRFELPINEAKKKLEEQGQTLKIEIVDAIAEQGDKKVSFYQTGDDFDDLCEGPHVKNTLDIPLDSFKLDKFSAAYWRADDSRESMQRIYGLAFETAEELKAFLELREEAKKRDHKVLGPALKLFTCSPLVGAGLPLLQPKGMIIRKQIEDYLWELHKDKGYHRVWSPHIAREDLYVTSGHAEKFGDELFRVTGKEDKFILKPMNCPHHMQIFTDNHFSYRDMPIRYFEPATVYRDEKSGQLGGLTRVRSITQDDGHLFCTMSQIKDEVKTISGIVKEFYQTLGMDKEYWVSLSVRDDDDSKYLGTKDGWAKAEKALEDAAKSIKLPYKKIEGEAAFYGPKLDFMFKDCLGREWQLATIQCDFNLPERFNLCFVNEKGEKERPVVIHRAISGSLERFLGVLIEHFAGAFPVWLAPVQVVLLPIADAHQQYCQELMQELLSQDVRTELHQASSESLNKRIRNAEQQKIPYMLVVGDKEVKDKKVAVRSYKTKEQEVMSQSDFVQKVLTEIKDKSL